jgi:arylsulfatase A-like enzyme
VAEPRPGWSFGLDDPARAVGYHGVMRAIHTPLLLSGAGIRPGARPFRARLVDVAPTISALLRVPEPDEAQGRALAEALDRRRR